MPRSVGALLLRVVVGFGVVASVVLAACETPGGAVQPDTAAQQSTQETPITPAPAGAPASAVPEQPAPAQPVQNEESSAAPSPAAAQPTPAPSESAATAAQDMSAAMFNEIAKVLQHPRCMNCHVSGKSPKQGDDRRVHMPPVERGTDGRGVGLTCKTCHSEKNGPVAPGAPDWHLAPVEMAWEGLSVADLCRTLTDSAKNGGRDGQALAKHMSEDPIVLWGWNPGGTRKPVPTAKEEFAKLVHAWADAGAACPQ